MADSGASGSAVADAQPERPIRDFDVLVANLMIQPMQR
jgi:hypothetical protein